MKETTISSGELRLMLLPNAGYPLNRKADNSLLDWDEIPHLEPLPYEITDSIGAVQRALSGPLAAHGHLYVELQSDMPVIQVPAEYFVEHWNDFVDASCGLGCIVTTPGFGTVIEFTADPGYLMYVNTVTDR